MVKTIHTCILVKCRVSAPGSLKWASDVVVLLKYYCVRCISVVSNPSLAICRKKKKQIKIKIATAVPLDNIKGSSR